MHLLQKTVLKYFVNLVNLKIIISLYACETPETNACETPETNAKWGFKIVQEKKNIRHYFWFNVKTCTKKDIEKKERIEVKAFPGATTNCLKHHVQPSISEKHDRFVIHCGTNNLNSEDTSKKIANDIIQGWRVNGKKQCCYFWNLSTQRSF